MQFIFPRLRKIAAPTIFVVLLGGLWLTSLTIDKASAATGSGISIPRAWGSVKGTLGAHAIFEDSGGVFRVVDLDTGKAAVTITRN